MKKKGRRTIPERKLLVLYNKYKAPHSVRLAAVKEDFATQTKVCTHCNRVIFDTSYWHLIRWAAGKTTHEFICCKRCAPSKDHVISIIDRDEIMYGIAYVDDFFDWEKVLRQQHDEHVEALMWGYLYNPYIKEEQYKNALRRHNLPERAHGHFR